MYLFFNVADLSVANVMITLFNGNSPGDYFNKTFERRNFLIVSTYGQEVNIAIEREYILWSEFA